jgi:hypothetical protein
MKARKMDTKLNKNVYIKGVCKNRISREDVKKLLEWWKGAVSGGKRNQRYLIDNQLATAVKL